MAPHDPVWYHPTDRPSSVDEKLRNATLAGTGLSTLRNKDFGALTDDVDNLYKRLDMRIETTEAWRHFTTECGSYPVRTFSEMYLVGREMGGSPKLLAGLVSENITEVLQLRQSRTQATTTLVGLLYGITAASTFVFFIGLQVVLGRFVRGDTVHIEASPLALPAGAVWRARRFHRLESRWLRRRGPPASLAGVQYRPRRDRDTSATSLCSSLPMGFKWCGGVGSQVMDDTACCTCTPVVGTRFGGDRDRSPSIATIEAIAAAEGVAPTELDLPDGSMDLEALDSLLADRNDASLYVRFSISGWNVFVRGDGPLRVCDPDLQTESAPVFDRKINS